MKEWTINTETHSYSLLIDKVTVLKGTVEQWKKEIDLLSDSFLKRDPVIQESNQRVVIQDYNFSILSYSHLYKSDNYTISKSKLDDLFFSLLELSPIYKQFVEMWEDLQEEVLLLNDQINMPLELKLKNYTKDVVKKKLTTHNQPTTSIDILKKDIELISLMNRNKKNIFLILSPENFLTQLELNNLIAYVKNHRNQFILVTDVYLNKSLNIKYNNRLINDIVLDKLVKDLENLLPFVWNDSIFKKAKNLYKKLVDNSQGNTVFLSYDSVDNLELFIHVFLLLYLTRIPFKLETTGISNQYQSYIDSIVLSGV